MSKKKKLIIICCAAVLLLAALATAAYFYFIHDEERPPTLEETVNNRVSAYDTDLTDSLAAMDSQAAASRYLIDWAENKGIDVSTDSYGNVIYTLPASEGMEDKNPVVIVCGYDYASMASYKNSIVCALTVAKNDMPHGEYRIIFVSEELGSKLNAEQLSAKYFSDETEVFCLSDVQSSRLSASTGGFHRYVLSKELRLQETSYDVAYKVSISGLPALRFSAANAQTDNPIKFLGELLADLKSSSILFELASFSGGRDADMTPQDAQLTIVVNADSATKLERRLDSAIENFYDDNIADMPELSCTYEVVDTPAQVINTEDTESIVSLLYTAISGVDYKDDNGDIASIANIGSITTDNHALSIEVAAASYDDELLADMATAYQTISALTDVNYSLEEEQAPFHAGEAGEALGEAFHQAYSDYQSIDLDSIGIAEWTPAALISSKNAEAAVITLGVTRRTMDNFAGGLITYLSHPAAE